MSTVDKKTYFNLISALNKAGLDDIAENILMLYQAQDDMNTKLNELTRIVEDLHKAFPSNDTYGHRLYHEKMIRDHISKEEISRSVKTDMITKFVWIAIGLIVTALGVKLSLG